MKNLVMQDVNEAGKLDRNLLDEMEALINQLSTLKFDKMNKKDYFEFNDFLNNVIANQQEDGSFPLVIDSTIPSDCYYWYVARPTYVILRVLIEYGNAMHYDAIDKCLYNYCKSRTFGGHGYDAMDERIKNVTMLLEVGVLSHCNAEITEHIENICDSIRKFLFNKYNGSSLSNLTDEEERFLEYADQYSFVFYGTLCKKCISHELIENATFIGNVCLPRTNIIQVDGTVSIKEDENSCFKNAELYILDESDVNEIDEYEGDRYDKKRIFIAFDNALYAPYIYVLKEYMHEINNNKIALLY